MITKIKQLFCKHKYVEMREISKTYQCISYVEMREISKTYQCISGEKIFIVCEKCGKVKDSYFREYEGMGHK